MEITFELPALHEKQKQVARSKAKVRVVRAGRQSGKSFLARKELIKRMLIKKKCAYLTPEYKLAKNFFNETLKMLVKPLIKSANKSELRIELITGGLLQFYSNNSIESIRGTNFDFWVIDEAAFTDNLEYAIKEVIEPTFLTRGVDMLIISSPCGFDYFNSLFLKGEDDSNSDYESFHFNLYDSPFISEETIEFLKSNATKSQWEQEYLGLPQAGENPFGEVQDLIGPPSKKPTVAYSVDLGRKIDHTVIYGLDEDGNYTYFQRFKKDWNATRNILIALDPKITMFVDGHGIGDVIVDDLRKLRGNIRAIIYHKEKENMIFHLIKLVEDKLITINKELAEEMSTMQQQRTSNGYTKFFAKSGYHDDCVMAYAMGVYYLKQAKSANTVSIRNLPGLLNKQNRR